MQYSILLSALCASSALAIQVTSPDNSSTWSDSGSNTIKWSSVSTDPSTMNIFLVNSAVYPPVSTQVASNVQVSSGSYQVSSLTGTGTGYQINLMSTTSGAILAQSNQFTLINVSPASGGVSSSASSSSMLSTTSSASAPASTASTGSTASTASTASVASTRSTMSTASSASTASTATASGTPSGTASAASTSGTSTASSTSSATPSSGATVNAINLAGLGLGGLLALFA